VAFPHDLKLNHSEVVVLAGLRQFVCPTPERDVGIKNKIDRNWDIGMFDRSA